MIELVQTFGQHHWQLLPPLLLLLLLLRIGSRRVGERTLAERFPRLVAGFDVLLLPLACLVAGTLARVANRAFGVPALDPSLRSLTLLLALLVTGWALARLIEVALLLRSKQNLGERMPKLVIGLIYSALLLAALGLYLWQRGYSFTGVWVSTGVAAAVLGFALQRTLGDLFSGIALGMERPFRLGDWLQMDDGTLGQVVDMNWRATHLRDWDNSTHIVPNSRMAGQALKNLHNENHLYAPWYFIKIPAEVDPRFATALLLDAALRCESILKFPNPIVRLADGSSVPYSYMVWVHLKNYPSVFRAREELFRQIHRGLSEAGIEVAPQVTEMRTRRARVTAAEPPTIALALKSTDFASYLTDDELVQIAARSEYRHYDAAQVLLAEGAVSDAFYVVAGGLVDSAVRLQDGSRKVVETLGPGKHFGITGMLTMEPSFLEYIASTDITVIRVELDVLRSVVDARPELAVHLASVVKERLDAAEAARVQSRRHVRPLTMRDIRNAIERRLRLKRGGER
ncbi:MAG: mechanosensitive ion channel [Thiohalocapsa sp.]|nr:mechanosensitive ion channel [Thiohalocapsa sp.]